MSDFVKDVLGKSPACDPYAVAPKVTVDGNPPNPQDAAPGGLVIKADPPASRENVGTVPGNAQPKPYKL
jgi:hypothetical protein